MLILGWGSETVWQTGFETGLQTGFGINRFETEAGFLMIPVSVLRFSVSVSVSGFDAAHGRFLFVEHWTIEKTGI